MIKTTIIGEAGVNHNGDIKIAKKLIDAAAEAKVDFVKFQTFKTENTISKSAPKADYQKQNTSKNESQYEMIKKLELDKETHIELINYCKTKNIKFLSTAFDSDSIDTLRALGISLWKIPSGEITNLPYLRKIGQQKQSIIMSTGMANLGEIERALNVLEKAGTLRKNITILHCNTEYPTPMQDVNLKAMQTIADAFKVNIGYSDHTLGIEIPIAAAAMGATVIEKHFTLDKKMKGPDHKASLEPNELKAMVKAVRNINLAMGSGIKQASPSELKNKPVARKSIVAKEKIKAGDVYTENNITTKRPGTGISPMRWTEVIGKKAPKNLNPDDLITL